MRRIVLPSLACPALQYFSVSHMYCCILRCLVCIVFICVYCCGCLVCIVVILCVFVVLCGHCFIIIIIIIIITTTTLDAGLLARSQYSECPAIAHLDTGFSWFPCAYKQRFQVATTCFSCSPPDLNLKVTNFIFCIHVK